MRKRPPRSSRLFPAIASSLTGTLVAAENPGFTIDVPITLAPGQRFAISADLTVAAPITVAAGGTLILAAGIAPGDVLAIDALITVDGNGQVNLTAGIDTTTAPGSSLLQLSSRRARACNSSTRRATLRLAINGVSYTLVFTMTELQAINTDLTSLYAMATPIDASGTTYTSALIGTSFATRSPARVRGARQLHKQFDNRRLRQNLPIRRGARLLPGAIGAAGAPRATSCCPV